MKKKTIIILAVQLFVSACFALLATNAVIDYNFFTNLGLSNLIIGLLCCFVGLIWMSIDKETGRTILAASGLLLLLGCLTCTFFPLKLNH